jgi:two-component system nitrate/nitrite sensor histidine kinase NarX
MNTNLRTRISLLFLGSFTLIGVSVLATYWITTIQESDALLLNLAGRQRMLVQQMARLTQPFESGVDTTNFNELHGAMRDFEQTLQLLTDGGEVPNAAGELIDISAADAPSSITALEDIHKSWAIFRDQLQVILAEDASSSATKSASKQIAILWPTLLKQADAVVQIIEANSEQRVSALKWIQFGFFTTAFLLLALGFTMTRKSILQPIEALTESADRIGSGDLDSQIETRGPEEIERLAWHLDQMRARLQDSTRDLEARIARRTQELSALYDVSREISGHLELEHVLHSVTDKARELLGGQSAVLCMLTSDNELLRVRAASGPEGLVRRPSTPAGAGFVQRILSGDRGLICHDSGCGRGCLIINADYRVSHIAAPLRVADRVIGALCVSSSEANVYSKDEVALLSKLASSAAIALENAHLYEQAERVATLEERQRIAAEMHDGIAQILSSLQMRAGGIAERILENRDRDALESLERFQAELSVAGRQVRDAITQLHDGAPLKQSLQDLLARMVEETNGNGQLVQLLIHETTPIHLPRNDTEQVVRVIQEALQNVCKHSGATHAIVRFCRSPGGLNISVEDNGCGFDPEAHQKNNRDHFGLSIMRARAQRLCGQLTVHSAQGKGTQVSLSWPVSEEQQVALDERQG